MALHLTLQQLKLFEAVARHRSFTRAAEELHLTQPAVSIQIKRLEDNAGTQLFEQIGKKIYLTPAGREMYAASQDILGRLGELESELMDLRGGVKGPLHLAVVTTAKYFIPYLLGAFVQDYPGVEPHLKVTNRANVIDRLNNNEDDLVIMGQVPEVLELESYPFLENPLVVVANPRHPLAGVSHVPLERLAQERFLVREAGSGTRMAVDRLFAEHNLQVKPYMELGSSEAIKQAVMGGLGISVLSLHNFRLELDTGRLIILNVEGFPLMRRWYAVHLKGKKLSKIAGAFLDFLLNQGQKVMEQANGTHDPEFPTR